MQKKVFVRKKILQKSVHKNFDTRDRTMPFLQDNISHPGMCATLHQIGSYTDRIMFIDAQERWTYPRRDLLLFISRSLRANTSRRWHRLYVLFSLVLLLVPPPRSRHDHISIDRAKASPQLCDRAHDCAWMTCDRGRSTWSTFRWATIRQGSHFCTRRNGVPLNVLWLSFEALKWAFWTIMRRPPTQKFVGLQIDDRSVDKKTGCIVWSTCRSSMNFNYLTASSVKGMTHLYQFSCRDNPSNWSLRRLISNHYRCYEDLADVFGGQSIQ